MTGRRAWLRPTCRIVLRVDGLEDRAVPAAGPADIFTAVVSAGSAKAAPSDTPDDRIDPNVTSSQYAGVGSIQVNTKGTSYVGTGTVIGKRYVLTAAHVVDLNNDGKFNGKDATTGVYFLLNNDGDVTYKIAVTSFNLHPDFTGFNHPAVNDDLAILTLAEDVPSDIPIYSLGSGDVQAGTVITMVGYGRSGDGVKGYTTPADPTVKRVGENTIDAFYGQDDRGKPEANEVFRYDFDGLTGKGPLGGGTLGNDRETTIGAGDSGAPAFTTVGGRLTLVGMATFTQGATAPKFGSMGGGVILSPYTAYINSVLQPTSDPIYTGNLPPSVPPPMPGLGARGGAGVGTGAKPLRNKLPPSSFPSAQDHPPTPPTPPPTPTPDPPPILPPPELPPPPVDPLPPDPPPTDSLPPVPPPSDPPPTDGGVGGDDSANPGPMDIDKLELKTRIIDAHIVAITLS
jgi:Trypsin